MTQATKDEKFIITAYHACQDLGDPRVTLDRYVIGAASGLTPRATDAICNLLARANFIRKLGHDEFYLTENGHALAKQLLGE